MNTIMKMLRNNGKMMLGLGIFVLVFHLTLTGCQMQAQRDMGKMVPSGNRVAIKSGGPFDERFQTDDMTVAYQYWKTGNQLKAQGTTHIKFESIKELVFHLYFLDEQGKVIDVSNFYSFLDDRNFVNFKSSDRRFHRDFTIPSGAVAFAIGYDGETGDGRDKGSIRFSYFPFE